MPLDSPSVLRTTFMSQALRNESPASRVLLDGSEVWLVGMGSRKWQCTQAGGSGLWQVGESGLWQVVVVLVGDTGLW